MAQVSTAERPLPSTPSAFVVSLFDTLSALSSRHRSDGGPDEDGESNLSSTRTAASRKRTSNYKQVKVKRELPHEARDIFLTLHVLFPHVLLDALDLLDRGCVMRLNVIDSRHVDRNALAFGAEEEDKTRSQEPTTGTASEAHFRSPDASSKPEKSTHQNRTENTRADHKRKRESHQAPHHIAHHVSSARPQPPQNAPSASNSRYTQPERYRAQSRGDSTRPSHQVHLLAWNCSCPAFAFAAHSDSQPALSSALPNVLGRSLPALASRVHARAKLGREGFTFGGLALSRTPDPSERRKEGQEREQIQRQPQLRETFPPVCKHLLACLLGEMCPEFFGPFSDEDKYMAARDAGGSVVEQSRLDRDGPSGMREMVVNLVEAAGIAAGGVGAAELLDVG